MEKEGRSFPPPSLFRLEVEGKQREASRCENLAEERLGKSGKLQLNIDHSKQAPPCLQGSHLVISTCQHYDQVAKQPLGMLAHKGSEDVKTKQNDMQ